MVFCKIFLKTGAFLELKNWVIHVNSAITACITITIKPKKLKKANNSAKLSLIQIFVKAFKNFKVTISSNKLVVKSVT